MLISESMRHLGLEAASLRALLALIGVCVIGTVTGTTVFAAEATPSKDAAAVEVPPGSGQIEEFLGCKEPGGDTRTVPVTRAEMPWRVAIGKPKSSPRYGSRQQARDAAIEAMQLWERSIQTRVPWFELAFVERDKEAPVQIEWKRRITGKAAGRGGPVCWFQGESARAGGHMEIAVRSCPTCTPLTVDQVKMLVAHEFGHILSLGHCLDCDSAMNYSWHTQDRVFVTETDVVAVAGLLGEAGGAPKAADTPNSHFAVEGRLLGYEAAHVRLKVRVTETDPRLFQHHTLHSSTHRDPLPDGITVDSELDVRVSPAGSVMERTVILSSSRKGLETTGSADGFQDVIEGLGVNRSVLLELETRAGDGDEDSLLHANRIVVYPANSD
ncbi:MAG: matrixin family metalloprotease [Deltaproteobacteria bacterium]|nr:matrixin family metalloprotease [Deltaproteobacteria bacterium]